MSGASSVLRDVERELSSLETRLPPGDVREQVAAIRSRITGHFRTEEAAMRELTARLNGYIANTIWAGGQDPGAYRWRYLEYGGTRYCWNTQPATGDDGRWFSWEYVPDRARPRKLVMRRKVRHATRTKARQRALERYHAARDADRKAARTPRA